MSLPLGLHPSPLEPSSFSILAFLLDSASDSLVALAKATTSFLLMGGEVGLGASYGGRTMEGEG